MKRTVLGALSMIGVALASPRAEAAFSWQPFNTCWSDFDVGGGMLCMLRNTACATAGINESDRLHCTSVVGVSLPPTRGQLGLEVPPLSKAVAVDSVGYAWLVSADNRIYTEDDQGEDIEQFSSPGLGCLKKLAVVIHAGQPRVLALGCDASKTLKRYVAGVWTTIATNVFDITKITLETGHYLGYISDAAADRPYYRSEVGGGGNFAVWQKTVITERWTYQGQRRSRTWRPKSYGGEIGLFEGFSSCTPNATIGPAWYHDFDLHEFLLLDPVGCPALQPPQGSGFPRKVAAGGLGPGNDMLWTLTDQGRVFGLLVQ